MSKTVSQKVVAVHWPFTDAEIAARISLEEKTYDPASCVVFCRVTDPFGGFSNMHRCCMAVNGVPIRTNEHLYQSCRFSMMPDVQRTILEKPSPLIAKRYSSQFRHRGGRPDWYQVKVRVMEFGLHVKLACNYESFGQLLDSTGDRIIVEWSKNRDDFWGAVSSFKGDPTSPLVGASVLGQLLMQLREEYRSKPRSEMLVVQPLDIPDFLLLGQPIGVVDCRLADVSTSEKGGAS